VVEFEPMLEVDTDKVSAEVPSPVSGILREILAQEGQTVQAGAEIAVVEVGADGEVEASPEAVPSPQRGEGQGDAAVPSPQRGEGQGEGRGQPKSVVAKAALPSPQRGEGQGEGREQPKPPVAVAEPAPQAVAATEPAPEPAAPAAAPAAPAPVLDGGEHRYSPAVQMQASELGVDLAKVQGTGIGGRVTKKDVEQFAATAKAAPVTKPPAAAPAGPGEGDQVVQLTRVRRLIAENMVRSKTTIPHAWQTQEADMSGVVAHRNANKAAFQKQEGFSLTYLPYVMAATISALREHPEVNSTFNETELIIHRDINLGISVGLEDTLIVPVVRRADGLSIAGLARAVNDLAARALSKQLKADDLAGGTFTVNNSGTFGTLFSYSVINPGQSGILTMEAIVERPMAVNGMIGIKPMMYLCFSFDHRVLDGLMAARFLTSCRKWLESVTLELPVY
jgi:2-oxoisovalerate dehydrogenase E2 component (dihydrolipoyl transacylase)